MILAKLALLSVLWYLVLVCLFCAGFVLLGYARRDGAILYGTPWGWGFLFALLWLASFKIAWWFAITPWSKLAESQQK